MGKKIKNAVLILGVGAMWMWFYRAAPYKRISPGEASIGIVSSTGTVNLGADLPPAPPFSEASNLDQIRICLKRHPKLATLAQKSDFKLQDLKELKDVWEKTYEQALVQFEFEGKSLRLELNNPMAEKADTKGDDKLAEARLYLVDAKGGLISRPLPAEWAIKSSAEIFQEIKKQFPITSLEKHLRWQIDGDTQLKFQDVNGKLTILELTFKEKEGLEPRLRCNAKGSGPSSSGLVCHCQFPGKRE